MSLVDEAKCLSVLSCCTNTDQCLQSSSNLMAPDEFKNLGFAEDAKLEAIPNHAGRATAHKVRDDGKKIS